MIGTAAIDSVVLWILIVKTMTEFYAVEPVAAYLLIPYFVWVSVVVPLTSWIWYFNPTQK